MAQTRDATGPLTADEQKRLDALRDKGPRGMSDAENKELAELESRAHEASRGHPTPTPTPATPTPAPTPTPMPAPGLLSPLEQARLAELRAMPEGERSAEEKSEFETLEKRNTLKPLPEEQVVRLRDLRLLHERNQLNDADRAELAKLSAAESEAAGHAPPVVRAEKADEGSWMMDEVVSLIRGIIEKTPAYRDLETRVRTLRARMDEAQNPKPDEPNAGRAQR